jgi:four helix bundle protein
LSSRTFRDVEVWQKAHLFVLHVYQLTQTFPREELFGLTSQLRRASVSITANFVEGFKKRSRPEKARYYNVAQASIEECKYFLQLADELRYCETCMAVKMLEEVSRMLEGYIRSMMSAKPTDYDY